MCDIMSINVSAYDVYAPYAETVQPELSHSTAVGSG